MSDVSFLRDQLRKGYSDDPWHVPATTVALEGVTAAEAAAHPIAGAHSIWEIVLHMTAWQNEVILEAARHGRLRSIDLLAGYGPELDAGALESLAREHQRISRIIIHSAPERRQMPPRSTGVTIEYRTEVIDSPRCCGQIHPGYFVVDFETFAEGRSTTPVLTASSSWTPAARSRTAPR